MVWLPQIRAATTASPPKNAEHLGAGDHIEVRQVEAHESADEARDHDLTVRDASFNYFNFY